MTTQTQTITTTYLDRTINAFSKTFIDLYDVYFPLKYVNRSGSSAKNIPRKPWTTPVILKSINRKQRLYKKYIGHPSITNKKNYKNNYKCTTGNENMMIKCMN